MLSQGVLRMIKARQEWNISAAVQRLKKGFSVNSYIFGRFNEIWEGPLSLLQVNFTALKAYPYHSFLLPSLMHLSRANISFPHTYHLYQGAKGLKFENFTSPLNLSWSDVNLENLEIFLKFYSHFVWAPLTRVENEIVTKISNFKSCRWHSKQQQQHHQQRQQSSLSLCIKVVCLWNLIPGRTELFCVWIGEREKSFR